VTWTTRIPSLTPRQPIECMGFWSYRARGQFSRLFGTTGTFPYHCAIHPGMVGTVTVH
jgi:plastocyanin